MLDSSLAYMVAFTSRLGSSRPAPTWRLVSDRHDPSTFSGVDVHYLKFTSAILSRDMTSGVTVETVGDDLGWMDGWMDVCMYVLQLQQLTGC